VADGDVPGSGAAGSSGAADGSGNGDEAAWLDLVARFSEPATSGEDRPWPEREHLTAHTGQPDLDVPLSELDPLGTIDLTGGERLARPERLAGEDEDGDLLPGPADGADGLPAADQPGVPEPPWVGPRRYGPRDVTRTGEGQPDPGDEHFVPPPPPPMPKIDPVSKGAWVALFGGPSYLLIATAAGWSVSGLAAFLAVAAFVGGFAILVLRMDNGGPRDSGPDDGAVV
jgi:hypothetical protein